MTQNVLSKDVTKIAFDQEGNGDTVILVGGAFQQRAIDPNTKQLSSLLSKHFTVIHYDRRGRGDRGDTLPYSVDREIEDIETLIRPHGSAFLFGMSSGVVLSLHAVAKGLPIKKLAVYEAPFNSGDANARRASEEYTKRLNSLLREGQRSDAVSFAMTTWGMPTQAIAGMKNSPAWPALESVAPTLAYDDELMRNGSVPTELIKSISVPVLVMDGGASPPFMREAAKSVASKLQNATYQTLQGQTHDVDPGVLAPILIQFFSSS